MFKASPYISPVPKRYMIQELFTENKLYSEVIKIGHTKGHIKSQIQMGFSILPAPKFIKRQYKTCQMHRMQVQISVLQVLHRECIARK